jgi:hypothetical protein
MKSGKRSAIARTMRVATTFTGAAACAAAFAPTAMAATHATATIPYRKVPIAERDGLRGAIGRAGAIVEQPLVGSIRSGNCATTPNAEHWLHVEWYSVYGAGPYLTCFGYKGVFGTSIIMTAQCGGTNHGAFYPGPLTYVAGDYYRDFPDGRYVSAISIAGWTGNTTACPL